MNEICLQPTRCNICGGKVIYTTNENVYGRKYGSGYCYLCTNCGAYVGTHRPRPKEALGLLADKQMRVMKMKCHDLFDKKWTNQQQRKNLYKKLADELSIPLGECHFGYFDLNMLNSAYSIIAKWKD